MFSATASWKKVVESRCPKKIRFYGIEVASKSILSDIKPILRDLRPSWDLEKLGTKTFSKGAVNHMLRVYQDGDVADVTREDSIVVRVHGTNLVDGVDHRLEEILAFQLASAADCFPAVLAAFRNGIIYQFVPGDKMGHLEFSDPDIIAQIAWKLYSLHHTDIPSVNFVQRGEGDPYYGVPVTYELKQASPGDSFVGFIEFFLSLIPTPGIDIRHQETPVESLHREIQAECEYLKEYLNGLPLPMTFSHTDLHPANIVYNDRDNEIFLIDFETAGFHIEYYDLARLFSYQPFDERLRLSDPDYVSQAEAVTRYYLICYRDAGYEFHGYNQADISEAQREHDLEQLVVGHKIMEICMYFFKMAHALSMANVLGKKDLLERIPRLKDLYGSHKYQLPHLAQWYKRLATDGISTVTERQSRGTPYRL